MLRGKNKLVSTAQRLAYDHETGEFFIEEKPTGMLHPTVTRKPLSEWGLVKELTAKVCVKRILPPIGDLEANEHVEFYEVSLTYTVEPKKKSIYLKAETQLQENKTNLLRVFMRDLDLNRTQPLPMPNRLTDLTDFPELSVKKSRGKLISTKEAVALLKSGECMGIFDETLTKRLI
jgi:hypothetical protein